MTRNKFLSKLPELKVYADDPRWFRFIGDHPDTEMAWKACVDYRVMWFVGNIMLQPFPKGLIALLDMGGAAVDSVSFFRKFIFEPLIGGADGISEFTSLHVHAAMIKGAIAAMPEADRCDVIRKYLPDWPGFPSWVFPTETEEA